MKKWLGRIGLALVGVVTLVILTGAGYEVAGRRNAAREFPPRGKLVDIGGRRIQIDCRGTGTPTVVFESGLDMSGSLSWYGVHDSIAKNTRACAYSRAGIMWSDPAPGAQSGKSIANDLHATLNKAGEQPPYVFVAHSLGGPYAMIYTKYFPSEVAGMVLVDASHPDQVERTRSLTSWTLDEGMAPARKAAPLARLGIVRKLTAADSAPPQPAYAARATAAYIPTSLAGMLKEVDAFSATLAEAGTLRSLGDRPLFVLSATKPKPASDLADMRMTAAQGAEYQARWVQMHNEEASWSSRSQHQLVPESGHYIQFEKPAVVIAAVRSVIDSVRATTKR
ncbi:MAG TPA: alpha/beta hydrolase [Gemmatimonadaceae bacterium]|nr:alpha/beta hydrolase [Gemmatimonadaceae bacterium]